MLRSDLTTAAAVSSQLDSIPRNVSLSAIIHRLPVCHAAGNTAAMVIQSRPAQLLLTRPRVQGVRFARQLRAQLRHPFKITYAPLLSPIILHPVLPELRFCAVVFTSETAVAAAACMLALPKHAFCVGDQTARAARRAGFATSSAAGDAEALVRFVVAANPSGRLLHLHGAETRGDVAAKLTEAGIVTHSLTVYRQEPCSLSRRAKLLLQGDAPVIVPLFSPRTAAIFVSQLEPTMRAPLYMVALSAAVAQVSQVSQVKEILCAALPNADAMITTVGQIADKFPVA